VLPGPEGNFYSPFTKNKLVSNYTQFTPNNPKKCDLSKEFDLIQ
jgi:hypothetical protein